MDAEPCKHDKFTVKSQTQNGPLTKILQHCEGCGFGRERKILSVQLDQMSDGRFSFICFSDTCGPWVAP